jgi:hypothetical protein
MKHILNDLGQNIIACGTDESDVRLWDTYPKLIYKLRSLRDSNALYPDLIDEIRRVKITDEYVTNRLLALSLKMSYDMPDMKEIL